MKKLELVTKDSDNIQIDGITSENVHDHYLTGGRAALLCNDSTIRLSRISELAKRLEWRDWNITGRRFTYPMGNSWTTGTLYYSEFGTDGNSNLVSTTNQGVKLIHPQSTEENRTALQDAISKLDNFDDNGKIKEIYDSMNSSEIYLYNVTKNTVDILNNSITIDVIPYNSDVYTNIIDLGRLTEYSTSHEISTRIDIGIQYSKNVPEEVLSDSGEVIRIEYVEKLYSKESTFSGFKYILDNDGKLKLVNNRYVENVGTDIVIEYINNVIRVIPKSTDVDECIISNCTITYGKL